MRFDLVDSDFVKHMRDWLSGLPNTVIQDFKSVMQQSPGFYPTTLLPAWTAELERRHLASRSSIVPAQRGRLLPVAHPGDYEWRFTDTTSRLLLDRAISSLEAQSLVVHIGTPSTFVHGISSSRHRHVLFEKNSATVDAIASTLPLLHSVRQVDLFHDVPELRDADAAICDPPWYPTDTLFFLRAAALSCKQGATVLLCQPTEATRPGIAEERKQLIHALPSLGFTLESVEPSAIRYEMPHFEHMSLRGAVPTLQVPADWRTGDLLVLNRIGTFTWSGVDLTTELPFDEVKFGPVRIKLRATDGPDLARLVEGDILDSVSRRDPVRARIGLWTSGNRVFSLISMEKFSHLIENCAQDLDSAHFSYAATIHHAERLSVSADVAMKLFDLLLVEFQEHLASREVWHE